MRNVLTIFRRELAAYFATPLAYVFIVIFLVMAGILTFFVGNFFERGQADLQPFFTFHPWLYVVLIPALSMRLWAEEWLIHGGAKANCLGNFSAIIRGVNDLRDVIYFLSIMIAFLAANTILIDLEKAE